MSILIHRTTWGLAAEYVPNEASRGLSGAFRKFLSMSSFQAVPI